MAGWSALGLTLALLGPGIIAMASQHFTRSRSSLGANAPWLGAFALLVAGVTAIARYGERLSWREIGFAGTSAWSIPFGLALFDVLHLCFRPGGVLGPCKNATRLL